MDRQIRAQGEQAPEGEAAELKAEASKSVARHQLDYLRVAIDSLCEIGNLEQQNKIAAVTACLLRAMTPLRNLEQKLVRRVELEQLKAHIESSNPTPGLAQK